MSRAILLSGSIAATVISLGGLAWGQSGSGVQFSSIEVAGNTRLSDAEVRGLCGIDAARTYGRADLQQALQCLGASGEFTDVNFSTEGRALIVNVREAPRYTGLLDVSVSADTDRGVSGRLYIEDRDLWDRGVRGSGELELSREEKTLGLSLVDPNLFGLGYRGGIALSYGQFEYDDATYQHDRLTVAPFLSIPLSETQSVTISAGVQRDEMYDIDPATSPILLGEGGERTSPFVRATYTGMFEPNLSWPTRVSLTASQTFLGLGEEHLSSITRGRVQAVGFVIPDRLGFALSLEAGHIESMDDDPTRASDRFFLGGSALRGFASRGIGPFDGGQFLGGNSYAALQMETNSPITELAGAEISGGAFVDIGAVWGLDNTAGFMDPVDDDARLRASVGLSMTVQVGEVPLNLYYAHPVEYEDQDNKQEFGISISTQF